MPGLNFWKVTKGLNLNPATAPSSPSNGDLYYDSGTNRFTGRMNGAFDSIPGLATTDTLTNKTISGGSNTLSNIADGSLSTSYLKADGSRALTGNWAAGAFSATHNSVAVGSSANTITALRTVASDTSLTFQTNGSTTAATIDSSQRIGLGGAATSVAVVQVGATNPLAGTNQIGTYANFAGTSAATNSIYGFRADVSTAAASFTADHVAGLDVEAITKGAGSTITRAISAQLSSQTVGTNNATIADNLSFSGSYFINSTNANSSAFAGSIQISGSAYTTSTIVRVTSGASTGMSGSSQWGVYSDATFGSNATTEAHSYFAQVQTLNSSFTIPIATAYKAGTAAKGASNTITRLINFYGDNQSAGSNNAFISDNQSFSGNFFIHSSSNIPSVIYGKVGLAGDANTGHLLIVGLGSSGATASGSDQSGVSAFQTTTSGATNSTVGFNAAMTTAAASYTSAVRAAFQVQNTTKGSGSTITRDIGFYLLGTPNQGTNNAILADNSSFTGDWFINYSGTRASTIGGPLTFKGVTDASSAASGFVGEYSSSSVTSPTSAPATTTYGDVASLTLAAGDYDVVGQIDFINNGATVTHNYIGMSTTTGNSSTGLTNGTTFLEPLPATATADSAGYIPLYRLNVSTSTTVYLKIRVDYSAGTPQYRGFIQARRVR